MEQERHVGAAVDLGHSTHDAPELLALQRAVILEAGVSEAETADGGWVIPADVAVHVGLGVGADAGGEDRKTGPAPGKFHDSGPEDPSNARVAGAAIARSARFGAGAAKVAFAALAFRGKYGRGGAQSSGDGAAEIEGVKALEDAANERARASIREPSMSNSPDE